MLVSGHTYERSSLLEFWRRRPRVDPMRTGERLRSGSEDERQRRAVAPAGSLAQRFDPQWQAIGTPPAVIFALFAAAVVIISFGASGGEEFLLHDEATNEVEHSQVFEDKTSTGVISEGTYSLTYGDNTSTITVDSSNSSLEKFAKELDTISGVRSMVMGAGSSADPYRLVLEGQDAGSEHSLWLSVESSNDT